jgi:hypothetical protein
MAVIFFEMGGRSNYPLMKGHVREERILSNTAVKVSKLTVFNHQFSYPLELTVNP